MVELFRHSYYLWLGCFYGKNKGKKKKKTIKRNIGEAIHIPGIGLLECGLSGIES